MAAAGNQHGWRLAIEICITASLHHISGGVAKYVRKQWRLPMRSGLSGGGSGGIVHGQLWHG